MNDQLAGQVLMVVYADVGVRLAQPARPSSLTTIFQAFSGTYPLDHDQLSAVPFLSSFVVSLIASNTVCGTDIRFSP